MAEAALIEVEGVDGSWWTLSGAGQGTEGVELGTTPGVGTHVRLTR